MPKIFTKQRVQFDFTPEALERLDRLEESTGASTRAEVIRNALKLYDWFVSKIKSDYVVEIRDEANEVVFRIPARVLIS